MERHSRLQAILEGKFLSLRSDISDKERPFVIPVHDPQGSIANSRYSKEMLASIDPANSTYEPSEVSTVTDFALHKKATIPQKPARNLPMPKTRYKSEHGTVESSSKFICEQPGRISPMHVVQLPGRFSNKPSKDSTMAWLQVLAGFFVIMDAQGLNQSYGVFQAYYESILLRTHSASSIAWIGSLQIFLLFFMSIFVSTQMDKGRFQHCFTGGSILLTVSVLATSFCKQYWQFVLAQGVGTGMGMGMAFGAGVPVLVSWFSSPDLEGWLGIATGIASAGGSVGGMIFPAIFVALVVLLTLIPTNLIVRERPGQQRRKGKPSFDKSMFTDVPYLLVMAGLFFTFWGVYFGFYYIVSYAQQTLHLSSTQAVNLLILTNASNLPGRFLPPLISDTCLGPLNTLIPSTFLTSSILFLWLGSSTSTSIHLVACFYGFASAGIQSLYNATVWTILKPSPAVMAARAKAVDEGVVGQGEEGKGSWIGAQVFAGSSVAVGGCLLVGARIAREGWGSGRV
ncbi:MAG: hypothetical protein L6R42_000540 [Xanthoria sp. 1 TBL-2021]|nr:MAG: hypothetical protein L6R42_000540 [Xanthoria sp. 1 TBL-2021]